MQIAHFLLLFDQNVDVFDPLLEFLLAGSGLLLFSEFDEVAAGFLAHKLHNVGLVLLLCAVATRAEELLFLRF